MKKDTITPKELRSMRARLRLMETAVVWYGQWNCGVVRPKPVLKALELARQSKAAKEPKP